MRNGGRNKGGDDEGSAASKPDLKAGVDMVVARSSQARAQLGAWKKSLSRQAKDHPARTLAIALGAGYLVGGGLFSRLTASLFGKGVRLGLRLAVIPLVTSSLASIGEGMFAGGRTDADDDSNDASESGAAAGQRHSRNHSNQKETRT